MRKYLFLLFAFAVACANISCEKEDLSRDEYVDPEKEESGDKTDMVDTNDKRLLGCWEYNRTDESEGQGIYVYRFWENGKGYITLDSYGSGTSEARVPMNYRTEGDIVYIDNNYSDKPVEWKYVFEGDNLRMTTTDRGVEYVFTFTKIEDADMRFIGDWNAVKKVGDKYIDEHFQFVTPTDGYTYYSEYTDLGLPPAYGPSASKWFKYQFDKEQIIITDIFSGRKSEYYYRLIGSKLYLTDMKGDEICYTDIAK